MCTCGYLIMKIGESIHTMHPYVISRKKRLCIDHRPQLPPDYTSRSMPSYHRYFYTTPSRRFIEALSENGYLYGILWPIIIHQAQKFELDRLQCVNRFFAKHAGLARTRFILDVRDTFSLVLYDAPTS